MRLRTQLTTELVTLKLRGDCYLLHGGTSNGTPQLLRDYAASASNF